MRDAKVWLHSLGYDLAKGCVDSFFFFQAEDGIRDVAVTGVQTCALPILPAGERLEQRRREHDVAQEGGLDDEASQPAGPRGRLPAGSRPCPPASCAVFRSEERRVGKEGRSRWSRQQYKNNTCQDL